MATGRACRMSLKPHINTRLMKDMMTMKNSAKRLPFRHMILTNGTLILLILHGRLKMSRTRNDVGGEACRPCRCSNRSLYVLKQTSKKLDQLRIHGRQVIPIAFTREDIKYHVRHYRWHCRCYRRLWRQRRRWHRGRREWHERGRSNRRLWNRIHKLLASPSIRGLICYTDHILKHIGDTAKSLRAIQQLWKVVMKIAKEWNMIEGHALA